MDGQASGAARGAFPQIERRRHPRVGVAWMASLVSGRGVADCLVIDVSLGGAKLAFADAPPPEAGAAATLDLGLRGHFRSVVVWRRGEFAGLSFLDPPDRIADALRGIVGP